MTTGQSPSSRPTESTNAAYLSPVADFAILFSLSIVTAIAAIAILVL